MARSPTSSANITSAAMAQFDVFVNPVAAMRRAYPLVVKLQSDFASDARDDIVAPMVPSRFMPNIVSRLTPTVTVDGSEHRVLVPALTGMRSRDLTERCCSIAASRSEVLAAIDYLFFGI